ncbi:MAG: hypothetical protein AAGA83_18115 [Cyanobacteria bacterium P01_F01_bin.116]
MAQVDGVLIGIGVVILVVSSILKLRVRSQQSEQQQAAWQWWYRQQRQQQHYQAEIVRDGLLQDAFALRRYLEKTDQEVPASYLEQFNHFYQTLEQLSNQLSPPFVEDSLPLALQFLIKQQISGDIPFEIDGSTDWFTESVESNQIVISIVDELLSLLSIDAQSPLKVRLWRDGSVNYLQFVNSSYQQDVPQVEDVPEVKYLKEIFHSLISGTLDIEQNDAKLKCRLSWGTNQHS